MIEIADLSETRLVDEEDIEEVVAELLAKHFSGVDKISGLQKGNQ